MKLATTFGGAGVVHGDLTAECAAIVGQVLDALGAKAGKDDDRTRPVFSGGTMRFDVAEFSGGMVSFDGAKFSGCLVNFGGARFSGGAVDVRYPLDWSQRSQSTRHSVIGTLRNPPTVA